ncbi:hypothetical protein F5X68DRAFT_232798 [Plectosphaerella plurivora]|uniref:Uncharacterized protein n=1 Tax=Plectosphaerella plurivora TaxID=936078 RepID=A0A9P8VBA9_9PEZI|nr:hypothetical protein F5X68DRAFT_232798 [Plectosphaerella plurivora]
MDEDSWPTDQLRRRQDEIRRRTYHDVAPRTFTRMQADLEQIQPVLNRQPRGLKRFLKRIFGKQLKKLHKYSPRFPSRMGNNTPSIENIKKELQLPPNGYIVPPPKFRRDVTTLRSDVLIKHQFARLKKEENLRKARRMRAKKRKQAKPPGRVKRFMESFRAQMRRFKSRTNQRLGEEDSTEESEDDFDYESDDYGSEFDEDRSGPMQMDVSADQPATVAIETSVIEVDGPMDLDNATDDEATIVEPDEPHAVWHEPDVAVEQEDVSYGEGDGLRLDDYFDSKLYYSPV